MYSRRRRGPHHYHSRHKHGRPHQARFTQLADLVSANPSHSSPSAIDGLRSYKVPNDQLNTNRSGIFRRIREAGNDPLTQEDRRSVTVGYDPTVFTQVAERGSYDQLLVTMKTLNYAQNDPLWRVKTKHRDLTSRIHCYANGFGEAIDAMPLNLTTGCAPNFMGSSGRGDEQEYLQNGRLKDPQKYKDTMKLLFKRWLMAQDNVGTQVLMVPFIGGGAYASQLVDEAAKEELYAQLYLALKEALEEDEQYFKHIQEVVFAIPNDDKGSKGYNSTVQNNKKYPYCGNTRFTIANVDVFDAAMKVTENGLKPGLINPGSDRTIGGKYQKTGNTTGNAPLEETIFNLTNASKVQPDVPDIAGLEYSNFHFSPYSPNLQLHADPLASQQTPPATSSKEQQFKYARDLEPIEDRSIERESPSVFVEGKEQQIKKIYSQQQPDVKQQAIKMWNEEILPLLNQGKKVALLYSANLDQASSLAASNVPFDEIFQGSGQAALYREIGHIIDKEQLHKKVRIIGIPTSCHGGDNRSEDNHVALSDINDALENVAWHIGAGYEVLGLGTTNPVNGNQEFSIGARKRADGRYDGESKGWHETTHVRLVPGQDGCLYQELSNGKPDPQGALSQGAYTESHLDFMATHPVDQWSERFKEVHAAGRKNMLDEQASNQRRAISLGEIDVPPEHPRAAGRMFAPQRVEAVKASNDLVQKIKVHNVVFSGADFIIFRGQRKGTFKVAFKTKEDAEVFRSNLDNISHPADSNSSLAKNVTFYGDNERYPMDAKGNVKSKGDPTATYKHIVRFEMPEDALAYLKHIRIDHSKSLYDAVMTAKPPVLEVAHKVCRLEEEDDNFSIARPGSTLLSH